MTFILAILIGAFLLSFLVFVHEAGHFLAAKFFGVKVEEFGFGFPPRVFGIKKGETIYSINAIPAGGFVRLLGEEREEKSNPRSFSHQGPWKRATIIVAGVMVNLLVATLLFTILLGFNNFRADIPSSLPTTGQNVELNFPFGQKQQNVLIVFVDQGSAAEKAGLKQLDEVVTADSRSFDRLKEFQEYVKSRAGNPIELKVFNLLDRETRTLMATPLKDPPKDQGALGVFLDEVTTIRYQSFGEEILVGPMHSVNMLYYQGKALGALFGKAVAEKSAEPVARTVSGPVGIVALIGSFIGSTGVSGFWTLFETIALLSLILAVMNFLPIPATDGGRLFFTLFEGITGRKVNQKVERWIHAVGFAVLIVLFVFITFNDLSKFF